MPVESFFACVGMPFAPRDRAHVALLDLAQREQHGCQLPLRKPVQEVALVLRRVERLQEFHARRIAGGAAHARIVAGRDVIGAKAQRIVEERAELDLAVAQHVGVRRAPGLVLAQEVREHALAVLGGEVDGLELDAEHVGHRRRVDQIHARRAVVVGVVVLPVLHEDADHLVPLLLQQPRGDGRVHAAGHADDDARAARAGGIPPNGAARRSPQGAIALGRPGGDWVPPNGAARRSPQGAIALGRPGGDWVPPNGAARRSPQGAIALGRPGGDCRSPPNGAARRSPQGAIALGRPGGDHRPAPRASTSRTRSRGHRAPAR